MPNEIIKMITSLEQLEIELHDLEVDTFEIEEILDLNQNAFANTPIKPVAPAPNCSTCSSCCSTCSSCTT